MNVEEYKSVVDPIISSNEKLEAMHSFNSLRLLLATCPDEIILNVLENHFKNDPNLQEG